MLNLLFLIPPYITHLCVIWDSPKKIFDECLTGLSVPLSFTDEYIAKAATDLGMDKKEFRTTLSDLTDRFHVHKQETQDWINELSNQVEELELVAKKALYATPQGKALLNEFYDAELGYMLSKRFYFQDAARSASSIAELLNNRHSKPERLMEALSGSQSVSYDWRCLAKQAQELAFITDGQVPTMLKERLQRIGMKPEFVDMYTEAAHAIVDQPPQETQEYFDALYAKHQEAIADLEEKGLERIRKGYEQITEAPPSAAATPDAPHAAAAEQASAQTADRSMSWLKKLLYSEETGRIHGGKAAGWAAAALTVGASAYALNRGKQAENSANATWTERSSTPREPNQEYFLT